MTLLCVEKQCSIHGFRCLAFNPSVPIFEEIITTALSIQKVCEQLYIQLGEPLLLHTKEGGALINDSSTVLISTFCSSESPNSMDSLALVASSERFCGFRGNTPPPAASVIKCFPQEVLLLVNETNEFLALQSSAIHDIDGNEGDSTRVSATCVQQATQLLLKWDAIPVPLNEPSREVRAHYIRRLDAYQ